MNCGQNIQPKIPKDITKILLTLCNFSFMLLGNLICTAPDAVPLDLVHFPCILIKEIATAKAEATTMTWLEHTHTLIKEVDWLGILDHDLHTQDLFEVLGQFSNIFSATKSYFIKIVNF